MADAVASPSLWSAIDVGYAWAALERGDAHAALVILDGARLDPGALDEAAVHDARARYSMS